MNTNKCALTGAKTFFSFPATLMCAGLLLIPSMLQAQSVGKKVLKEVKVTGQTVTKQSIIPSQKITVQDFKRYSADNVADAIRGLSGVNIKDYGGIGGISAESSADIKLEESRCNNLKRCVNETRNYWKQKLNDKISRQAAGIQYVMSIVTCIVSFHH